MNDDQSHGVTLDPTIGSAGQWNTYATCSISYPVSTSPQIVGDEPGFQITATGTASAWKTDGRNTIDLTPTIYLQVADLPFPAVSWDSSNQTWTAVFNLYRVPAGWDGGPVPIAAWATAGGAQSPTFSTTFWANLTSRKPVVHGYQPASGFSMQLGEYGGELPVAVTVADAAHYGGHAVSVTSDSGHTAPLQPDSGSTTTYSGSVHFDSVDASSLANRSFTINAACAAYPDIEADPLTVGNGTATDVTPPDLVRVTSPATLKALPTQGTSTYTVTVIGVAHDLLSGMVGGAADVQVALAPGGPHTNANPARGVGRLDDWTVSLTVPLGQFNLYAWATDAAGNSTPPANPWFLGSFTAVTTWVPDNVDDRLSGVEYLQDLITFALNNIGVWYPGSPPIYDENGNLISPGTPPYFVPVNATDLISLLAQPVDVISATPPAPVMLAPVNELRVPIEILRAHMAGATPPVPADGSGQRRYLTAAYQALLAGIGTSYLELREARGASATDRTALANRLGIPLTPLSTAPRPDRLDAITLDLSTQGAGTLTEQSLHDLFGLTVTAPFGPAAPPAPPATGSWQAWQAECQSLRWQQEDRQRPVPLAYHAIVDPDVISEDDLSPNAAATATGALVISLLGTRRAALGAQATTLAGVLSAHRTDADGGLAALAAAGLPVDVVALAAQEQQGVDITGQLAAAGLERLGFRYLLELHALATAPGAVVTDAEWENVIAVLVGAYRRRLYPSWVAAEQGGGASMPIVLSPDIFTAGPDRPGDALRVSPSARRDWLNTLRARTLQRDAVHESLIAMIADAERTALPLLRDALLADIAAVTATPPVDPATAVTALGEQLTSRYFTDMLVAGTLTSTRVEQATTSLQTLLIDTRSGTTALGLRAGAAVFDADWAWIGTIDSWRAATTAFLFPEQYLDPSHLVAGPLVPPADDAFGTLRDHLFGGGWDVPSALADYVRVVQPKLPAGSPQLAYDNATAIGQVCSALEPTNPNLAVEIAWAVPVLLAQRMRSDRRYQEALDQLTIVYGAGQTSCFDRITVEIANNPPPPAPDLTLNLGPGWSARLSPFALVNPPSAERPYPYLRATLLAIADCMLDWADAEFAVESDESVAHARDLYRAAIGLLDHPRFTPVTPSDDRNGALPIPRWRALRVRAVNQLDKVRQDRNIAGLPRSQTQFTGLSIRQPTPYRFKVLLARAQQLTQQAAGLEAQYLAALEKFSTATLTEFDAHNAAAVAAAQLAVHKAQAVQATDAAKAARAQHDKATTAVATLADAIAAPPNRYEQDLIQNYADMRGAQDMVAGGDFAIGLGSAIATSTGGATPWGIIGGALAGALQTQGVIARYAGQLNLDQLQQSMQQNQLLAGIENRAHEWRIQLANAQQDVLVAAAQVAVADDQVAVADKEYEVAGLQDAQAGARLRLIQSQFTNSALYKWLGDTLGGVYRFFLQQATATARLAQAQLAFERAETAPSFLQADYWQPPSATPAGSGGDVRGLAGAERLAEDIAKIDGYAVTTDTRRLNITQTFSLAALAPLEFLDFTRTGRLAFATPTDLFDRDFPGHHHRLIRQVRLSIVALVPPSRGVRASLTSNGISRVITPDDTGSVYGEVVLRRDPGVVSFTSPVDASGVFPIDLQPDMLLPFEGSGVDTTWELTLPRPANPFDFRTISDALFTVDYTALHTIDYEAQVIRRLNADLSRQADLVFSLARDFPDQWYNLHNPDAVTPAGQRTTTLTLRTADLPSNLDPSVTVQTNNVAIRLAGQAPLDPVVVTIGHTAAPPAVTGTGTSQVDPDTGIASTRRGGLQPPPLKTGLVGLPAVGDWTLTFQAPPPQPGTPPTPDPLAELFGPQGLDDIVLVVSWSGSSLQWQP